MHKKLFNALYVINIIAQAFFTLVFPAGVLGGLSWLAVKYLSAPGWIYVPAIVVGVLLGFYSMVRFVLAAMSGLERLNQTYVSKTAFKT